MSHRGRTGFCAKCGGNCEFDSDGRFKRNWKPIRFSNSAVGRRGLKLYIVKPMERGRKMLLFGEWKIGWRVSLETASFNAHDAVEETFENQVEALAWKFGGNMSDREERLARQFRSRLVPRYKLRARRVV